MKFDPKQRKISKEKLEIFSERLFALTRGSQNMMGKVTPDALCRIITTRAFQLFRFWETEVYPMDEVKQKAVVKRQQEAVAKKSKAEIIDERPKPQAII